MIYISTVKTLPEISEVPEINEDDRLHILYKSTETVKMPEVEALCNIQCEKYFVEFEDRNDMLVTFGVILSQLDDDEECVLVDPTLPVPKRFEDRVRKMAKQAKNSKKKSTPRKPVKKEPVAEKPKVEEAEEPVAAVEDKPKVEEVVNEVPVAAIEPSVKEPEPVAEAKEMSTEEIIEEAAEIFGTPIPDDAAEKLQELIKVEAPADYPFPITMFYMDVAQAIADAKDNAEIEEKLTAINNGNDALWKKAKTVLSKAKRIVGK